MAEKKNEKKEKYQKVTLTWKNAGQVPVRKRKSDGKYIKSDIAAGNKKEKEAAKKAGIDNYQIRGVSSDGKKANLTAMSKTGNADKIKEYKKSVSGCK